MITLRPYVSQTKDVIMKMTKYMKKVLIPHTPILVAVNTESRFQSEI